LENGFSSSLHGRNRGGGHDAARVCEAVGHVGDAEQRRAVEDRRQSRNGAFRGNRTALQEPAADVRLGVASPLRRLALAWLLADRGALDRARTVAAELGDAEAAACRPARAV
jgi:hypothetical protein